MLDAALASQSGTQLRARPRCTSPYTRFCVPTGLTSCDSESREAQHCRRRPPAATVHASCDMIWQAVAATLLSLSPRQLTSDLWLKKKSKCSKQILVKQRKQKTFRNKISSVAEHWHGMSHVTLKRKEVNRDSCRKFFHLASKRDDNSINCTIWN
jgi:hypothetical protein